MIKHFFVWRMVQCIYGDPKSNIPAIVWPFILMIFFVSFHFLLTIMQAVVFVRRSRSRAGLISHAYYNECELKYLDLIRFVVSIVIYRSLGRTCDDLSWNSVKVLKCWLIFNYYDHHHHRMMYFGYLWRNLNNGIIEFSL